MRITFFAHLCDVVCSIAQTIKLWCNDIIAQTNGILRVNFRVIHTQIYFRQFLKVVWLVVTNIRDFHKKVYLWFRIMLKITFEKFLNFWTFGRNFSFGNSVLSGPHCWHYWQFWNGPLVFGDVWNFTWTHHHFYSSRILS